MERATPQELSLGFGDSKKPLDHFGPQQELAFPAVLLIRVPPLYSSGFKWRAALDGRFFATALLHVSRHVGPQNDRQNAPKRRSPPALQTARVRQKFTGDKRKAKNREPQVLVTNQVHREEHTLHAEIIGHARFHGVVHHGSHRDAVLMEEEIDRPERPQGG